MSRRLLAVLLLAGCATARPQKISFEEASASPGARAKAVPFDASLARFHEAVRRTRLETPTGAAMPASHAKAWAALLDDTERFARRKASAAWTQEAVRARLQLEAEFQADARLFGDVPLEVAERVPRTLAALSQRLSQLSPRTRQVDPRSFSWPVSPLVVSSPYGARLHPIAGELRFHAGIDLEAPLEHPVVAAESGTVVFADWNGGHGNQIEVQHDAHWSTRYSHLEKRLVKSGAQVKKGQLIGLAGATGVATGPHLHFELRRDGDALDPEAFLRAPLLPGPLLSEAR